jgi:hypothetical protein
MAAAVFLAAAAALASGCSDGGGGPTLTPVTGVVNVDGQPASDVFINFIPLSTPAIGAQARTDASGNFEMATGGEKGVAAGKYKVLFERWVNKDGTPFKIVDTSETGIDMEQLKMSGEITQSLPARYSSFDEAENEIEVVDGKPQEKTFELIVKSPTG